MAIHASHSLHDHFPDALLYANLHGATYGVRPLTPIEVITRFLRALGIAADRIPHVEDEAAALLRDCLVGRRALIVLDNAAGPEQIRHLARLPQGTAVLVTSREILSSVDDCAQIRLGALTRSEAITMMAKLVGAERFAADPPGATKLVNLCDRLPLALRVVSARLAERPGWALDVMIERLQDERRRLAELEAGDLGMYASLNTSYEGLRFSDRPLDREAALVFVRLGLVNLNDVTPDVASVLLNRPLDFTERTLERLMMAHLLEVSGDDRYRFHDLIRLFARDRSRAAESERDQHIAFQRVLSYYLATTQSATRLMDPHRVQPPIPVPKATVAPYPLSAATAFEWLEQERANLLAISQQALIYEDEQIVRHGIGMAFAMSWYLYYAVHSADLYTLSHLALSAARRIHDLRLEADALWQVSISLERQGFHVEAIKHQKEELQIQRRLGNRFAEMRTLGNLAVSLHNSAFHDKALTYAMRQLALAREIGSRVGERHALYTRGCIYLTLGDIDLAQRAQHQALTMADEASDEGHLSAIRREFGKIYLATGRPADARAHFQASLRHARAARTRFAEPECLVFLARCDRKIGELDNALECAEEALDLSNAMGDRKWARQAADERAAILGIRGSRASIPTQCNSAE